MTGIQFHIIIPARYQSSRLPGKPLLDIAGKPMIQRVVEQCSRCDATSVVVATDDSRIESAVNKFGGRAVMTSGHHASGTDRIAEAAAILRLEDDAIIVNVQGDEPDMPPALVKQVANALFADPVAVSCTASTPIDDTAQLHDPSVVKVVTDKFGYALYFSRAPVPLPRHEQPIHERAIPLSHRHLGIYAYRAAYVREFAARPVCQLEELEKLEQLRTLWYGEKILCVEASEIPGPGIDTEQDLERARKQFSD
jgi:3-deoxy-manno-octulosonate cytidylyltransferase (CMP-KDO synthetase)